MKKNIIYIVPVIIILLCLIILFMPAGRITFDKSVSKNRIVFNYEIVGCGSVVTKVLDGGEQLTADYINQYPDIGLNEVVFTHDSPEPRGSIDEFEYTSYTYVATGEPVGVTQGAPDCCEPVPAYNENVVHFKVDKWYYASYVPYVAVGNIIVILIIWVVVAFCLLWLIPLFIVDIYKFIKKIILGFKT